MMHDFRFPFGRPVQATEPSAYDARAIFILGAYPSALHVGWTSPHGAHINALPVDNEPEPFWDGGGASELVEAWKAAIGFDQAWGEVGTAFNGSSGIWVRDRILAPLGVDRENAWITDCLDIYHASDG